MSETPEETPIDKCRRLSDARAENIELGKKILQIQEQLLQEVNFLQTQILAIEENDAKLEKEMDGISIPEPPTAEKPPTTPQLDINHLNEIHPTLGQMANKLTGMTNTQGKPEEFGSNLMDRPSPRNPHIPPANATKTADISKIKGYLADGPKAKEQKLEEDGRRAETTKDLKHIENKMREYLRSFITVGFTLDGDRVTFAYSGTAEQSDSLAEHFRATFFKMVNTPQAFD